MAYKKRKNKRFSATGFQGLQTDQSLSSQNSSEEFYELETAEVVDVILSEDHEEFLNYEDIGKVKFRFVESQRNTPEEQLFYARPVNPNIQQYPVIHEMVVVARFAGLYFYTDILNYRSSKNHNELPYVSIDPELRSGATSDSQNYQEASTGLGNTQESNEDAELGEVFEATDRFKPLFHNEGDLVIEGRFGNSIRFTSNQETTNPTIRIKCGQPESASDLDPLERITENINDDPSSIYLSEDETFDLIPTTDESGVQYSSVSNPPDTFSGKQVLTVSDRIVMNARDNGIFLFSSGDIALTTRSNLSFDVEQNVVSNVLGNRTHTTEGNITKEIEGNVERTIGGDEINNIENKVVWNVPEMYFGEEDQSEPIVLGQTLLDLLDQLLQALQSETHPTPTGPSGPPINSAQYAQIQQQLQTILSQQNFTQ